MVFTSPFADSRPHERFKELVSEFFWHQLDLHAGRTLLVDHVSGREWTGAQVKRQTERVARYLVKEAGLRPCDSCVFFCPNSDHAHLAALAVLFAGGSVCAGAPADPAAEHRYMIEAMKPALVFAERALLAELRAFRAESAGQLHGQFRLCLLDDDQDGRLGGEADWIGLHRHMYAYEPPAELPAPLLLPVQVSPDDPAYVLLTSGSTGRPKPVSRSHRNSIYVCHSLDGASEAWHMDQDSVLAGHLPLDHGTGTFSIKMALTKGLKLILMDGYQEEVLLEAVERHQITDLILGSALVHNLCSRPAEQLAGRDLSSLRNLIAVGSPIPSHAVVCEFMDRYPALSVRQAFGMTECGFLTVVRRSEARSDSRTVGPLLPNARIRLLDRETGAELEEFERDGELYVTGPTVSPGYLGAQYAEQAREAFGDDGFYRSRDICALTEDRRLVIRGRCNDVLCLGDGWKVLPYEIEAVLLEHPLVLEAAVLGVPNPDLPTCHAVRAYVVPSEAGRGQLTEAQVIAFAAQHLSEPKRLYGGVRIMDSLPRISVGKVDKRALRKMDGY